MDRPSDRDAVIREFNRLYYHGLDGNPLFQGVSYLGVQTLKCPLDLWIYQEVIERTRPEVIVECGVHCGGTTLFLASMCSLLGIGTVIAVDVTLAHVDQKVRNHPLIRLFESSSISPAVHSAISALCKGKRTMVILDSNHTRDHVLQELRLYGPLVSEGCYLICEDTNVNGHPVLPDFGPGPWEALQEFLAESKHWYIDKNCERLLVTFNPSGYLLRLPNGNAEV
jgi:cephalosporin hydroxylase